MPEMLILNPARHRKARKSKARTRRRTRRNPINNIRSRIARPRRSNPFLARKRAGGRRRSNPIRLRGAAAGVFGQVKQVKDALIGATGAIGVDLLFARVNPMLPAQLQRVPGKVGVGDAIQAVATAVLGIALSRYTKGLSKQAAAGALTVQAHRIAVSLLPPGMVVNGLGWASPGLPIPGSARIGPMRQGAMNAYLPAGSPSPLLNRYMRPGASALLNARGSARDREQAVR